MDEGVEILVGRWDCSSCGARGVLGDAYRCHSCGAGRPDDVEFYLPSDAEVVKDAAGIASANAGSDWLCDYCRQWVTATLKECPNCAGGELAGAKRQKAGEIADRERGAEIVRELRREREARGETTDAPEPAKVSPRREPRKPVEQARPSDPRLESPSQRPEARAVLSCLGVFAALSLLIAGCWAIFHTTTAVATVTGHSWTRVQHVEEYRTLTQDGWDRPADAYNVRSERREHHRVSVLDHYETKYRTVHNRVADGTERVKTGTRSVSLGNGRFKREPVYSTRTRYRTVDRQESYQDPVYRRDPVYQDYYFYLVDRWVPGDDRREQGVGLAARWPSATIRDAKQRMASREESYSISLTEKAPEKGEQPRMWTRSLDEVAWRSWPDGATTVLTLRLGGVIDMQGLEASAATPTSAQ